MKFKSFVYIALALGLVGSIFIYIKLFRNNTVAHAKPKYLYIRTGSNIEQVLKSISDSNLLKDEKSFLQTAQWLNLKNAIHPGRYEFESGMGNYSLVSMLKSGRQKPVKLVINKLRTKDDVIRKISTQLEADSNELRKLFEDSTYLKKYGINSSQIQCAIMPATYEFYWNTKADKAFEKIAKSYENFWTEERKHKATALNLSVPQVITIASIVEEETNKNDEKPNIASVYLNRYKIGMKLGADPTVKFAVGNFALKRILNVHTQFPSPYNTYYTNGLPPGPICTPSAKSIDAVLNPTQTKFLFFCAKEDFSGYHNFAETYAEHLANARRYQDALNKRGIK